MTPSSGSVTCWLEQLKGGDAAAAQPLWENYFRELVRLARKRLGNVPRRAADEEDVALSAFDSFCRGAEQGRFPRLEDRHDLWQLLVMITARKAIDLAQHEGRIKRGGGKVQDEALLRQDPAGPGGLPHVVGREPSPEFAALVAEECRRLLERLQDDQLRAVALWKMEGYSNDEIATRLGRSLPTVERKLQRIRSLWAEEEKNG